MEKNILVISAGLIHPSLVARKHFSCIMQKAEGIMPVFKSSVEDLTLLAENNFHGVVLYFHRSKISSDALNALEEFVSQGGGLLAVHSASASFKQAPSYFDIIGGRFVDHGKIEKFLIYPADDGSEIYSGINSFSLYDELYIHEYQDDVKIHFYADNHGTPEPAVWTRAYKNGRVAYAAPGHCAKVMITREIEKILCQSLNWLVQ